MAETRTVEAMPSNLNQGSIWYHRKCVGMCAVVLMSSWQYGMDYGLIGGLQAMPGFLAVFGYKDPTQAIGYGIDPTVQQLINSLMTLGAFLGCLSVGPLGKYIGRRWTTFLGCILNQIGAIMMVTSTSLGCLYASRIFIGLGNGIFMVIPQLYVHECGPAHLRGILLGMFSVWQTTGSIVGSIVDNFTAPILSKAAYQIPCGLLLLVPAFLMGIIFFVPESPRWLIEHGQMERARKSLTRLRPSDSTSRFLDAEIDQMHEACVQERELAKGARLVDMFKGTNLRRTVLSICLVFSLSATGNLFIIIYGTYFFTIAGETNAFAETIGINCAGLAGVLASLLIISRINRRIVLLGGAGSQAMCMLIIGIVSSAAPSSQSAGRVLVAFVILFMFFYNMCSAPYLYLVAGEIPSQHLRAFTLGTATSIGFVGAWIASYTVPYFINPLDLNWGPKYSYIWFGGNAAYFIFIFFFVPETKDRTLEELDEMFENKVGAWKFRSYVCTGSVATTLARDLVEGGDKTEERHVNYVEYVE